MADSERIKRVSFDLDGVFVPAPFSRGTAQDLLIAGFTGGYHLKPHPEVVTYTFPGTMLRKIINYFDNRAHAKREPREQSLQAVTRLESLRDELGINLEIGVVTGRDPSKVKITEDLIKRHGLDTRFAFVRHNPGYKSPIWKQINAREFVAEGDHFHFEDDWEPSERMAQEGTFVYMMDNLSNREWLLRRAGVRLGANIMRIFSIAEGMNDLETRLRKAA